MVKDETSTFLQEETKIKTTDTTNPDVMAKWVGVAEKGIGLVEQLINMKSQKNSNNGGETSAYEKGLSQGLAKAQAQLPAPTTPAPTKAILLYKEKEAEEYLFEALKKVNQDKTLKEYIEGDLLEAKENGILNLMIKKFLENFTELKQ